VFFIEETSPKKAFKNRQDACSTRIMPDVEGRRKKE
jgi:hypothetical protein